MFPSECFCRRRRRIVFFFCFRLLALSVCRICFYLLTNKFYCLSILFSTFSCTTATADTFFSLALSPATTKTKVLDKYGIFQYFCGHKFRYSLLVTIWGNEMFLTWKSDFTDKCCNQKCARILHCTLDRRVDRERSNEMFSRCSIHSWKKNTNFLNCKTKSFLFHSFCHRTRLFGTKGIALSLSIDTTRW